MKESLPPRFTEMALLPALCIDFRVAAALAVGMNGLTQR